MSQDDLLWMEGNPLGSEFHLDYSKGFPGEAVGSLLCSLGVLLGAIVGIYIVQIYGPMYDLSLSAEIVIGVICVAISLSILACLSSSCCFLKVYWIYTGRRKFCANEMTVILRNIASLEAMDLYRNHLQAYGELTPRNIYQLNVAIVSSEKAHRIRGMNAARELFDYHYKEVG